MTCGPSRDFEKYTVDRIRSVVGILVWGSIGVNFRSLRPESQPLISRVWKNLLSIPSVLNLGTTIGPKEIPPSSNESLRVDPEVRRVWGTGRTVEVLGLSDRVILGGVLSEGFVSSITPRNDFQHSHLFSATVTHGESS